MSAAGAPRVRWRRPCSLLLDVREDTGLRGYHAMAALALMAPHLAGVRLAALTSGSPDEGIALAAFRFDTDLDVTDHAGTVPGGVGAPGWLGRARAWLSRGAAAPFDLYAMIADRPPDDALTAIARGRASRTLLGLTGPAPVRAAADVVTVDGNDTRAFASAALDLLGRPGLRRGRA